MAFEYLGSGSVDLFNLIFIEILKIDSRLLIKYTAIQEQVFYLILLPHVVLFLFLFGFGMLVVPENKGLRYLVTIVAYIFIVMQGWYGSFLIPLLEVWFWMMLVFGLFLFFIFRIIHPSTAGRLGRAGLKIGEDIGKKLGKEKQIERLYEELEDIKKQEKEHFRHIKDNPGAAKIYAKLEDREFKIKRKIKKLGG